MGIKTIKGSTTISMEPATDIYRPVFDKKPIHFVLDKHGVPWFKAHTIASILGYQNTRKKINKSVKPENRKVYKNLKHDGSGKLTFPNHVVFVNKLGVDNIVVGSRKSIAERFLEYIHMEVLPKIGDMMYISKKLYNEEIRKLEKEINSLKAITIDRPADENKLHSFVVIKKNHAEPIESISNYPYYVLRRQKRYIEPCLDHLKKIYPGLRVIFKFDFMPNAINFFNVLKEVESIEWKGNHVKFHLDETLLIPMLIELHENRNVKEM